MVRTNRKITNTLFRNNKSLLGLERRRRRNSAYSVGNLPGTAMEIYMLPDMKFNKLLTYLSPTVSP
jgi:hypothetical protein